MTHTTDDGCRLAVEVEGGPERPAIVLLNSLGTNHRLWDRQMPALTGWRVVRTDMRGHGASDAPAALPALEEPPPPQAASASTAGSARPSMMRERRRLLVSVRKSSIWEGLVIFTVRSVSVHRH